MVFSSLTFLIVFLPIVLGLYFLIPKKQRKYRNYFLFAVSVLFYSWTEPIYVFLIIGTIFLTFLVSKAVSKGNRGALIIAIVINLLPLAFFKYTDFFISNVNLLKGVNITPLNITLPIGISFYTFQSLTYIVDLYRKKVAYQKNPIYLGLYVFLFPQLIAGPIVRYETIEKEIEDRNETFEGVKEGFSRFIIGLAKKVLIANQVGHIVSTVNAQSPEAIGGGLMWFTALAFAIQIYFDFSGYSDMAIGMGRIFGFHFLENFNSPYASRSITEFWRRWHISLSTFFRDYVYIPLGGNRVKWYRVIVNMLFVWFLTGMWHGPFWNYILWGVYYGILIIIEKYILGVVLKKIPMVISWFYTFILTLIGWTIFMTETNNIAELSMQLRKMVFFWGSASTVTIRSMEIQPYIPFVIMGLILSFPLVSVVKNKEILKNKAVVLGYNVLMVTLYALSFIYIVAESFNPFLYFRF